MSEVRQCQHCNVQIYEPYEYCQYCAHTELSRLQTQLAELREAVGMAMESHTVDGYVNWDNVAALLPTPEEPPT